MATLHRSGFLLLGVLLTAACGGGNGASKNAQVSMTSAKVPSSGGSTASTELDDVRRRAENAEERANAAEEAHARDRSALHALLGRDMLLDAAWVELDRIDEALRALKAEIPRAEAKRRAQMQKVAKDAATKRDEVEKALRHVHAVSNEEWRPFVVGIAGEIEAIEDALQSFGSSESTL